VLLKLAANARAATIETGNELPSILDMPAVASRVAPYSVQVIMFAMFVAFVAGASSGLPLLFDGCNYLFTVVHYGEPCLPYYRNALALVHYPAIWAAQFTGQLEPAIAVFCSLLSVGPLLSLSLCWLLVRSSKPALLIWPVLGIALTGIFAQPFRFGENLLACELAWPLLLGVLVPPNARNVALVVTLGIWVANLHPVALLFLPGVAAVALLQAYFAKRSGAREDARIFLGVFCLLTSLAAARWLIAPPANSAYEAAELSSQRLSDHLQSVTMGGLIVFGLFSLVPGFCVFFSTLFNKKKALVRVLCIAAFVFTAVTGIYAIVWSSYFQTWINSWSYLRFLVLLVAPLYFFAIIDSYKSKRLDAFRSWLSVSCALLFMACACEQAHILNLKTEKLKRVMAASPYKVLDRAKHSITHRNTFDNWSISAYSLIIQGRNPQKVILSHGQVEEARKDGKIRLAIWDKAAKSGFFHLPDTREVVTVEYETLKK